MQIYKHRIPCSHFVKKSDLIAPPGVDMSKLSNIVGTHIARTIRHEAAHKERWMDFIVTHKKKLDQVNVGEEENFAETKEQEIPEVSNKDVSGGSNETETMTNDQIIDKALPIIEKYSSVRISRDIIEDARLSPDREGEFEATQGPDDLSEDGTVAIDVNSKKLKVDVDKIVSNYNQAIQGYLQNKPANRPIQQQTPAMEQPVAPSFSPGNAVPSIPSAPSVGAR